MIDRVRGAAKKSPQLLVGLATLVLTSCMQRPAPVAAGGAPLPASVAEAAARLAASPRHGEWAMIRTGEADSVRSWIVYPERPERAPVVLVVHEIFGLSHWVRAVADQLAADGFVAVAPDLLTAFAIPETPAGEPDPDRARAVIRQLETATIHRQLRAVAEYAMALPAALPSYGIIGFCWGGTVAFQHAAEAPEVGAAVVFYGASPPDDVLQRVHAPVLGLYAGDDARVNTTIAPAGALLRSAGRTYRTQLFDGAGHGFLRAQDGRDGANLEASRGAWPLALDWLRMHLAQ